MKLLIVSALCLALGTFAFPQATPPTPPSGIGRNSPFYCNRLAIKPEDRKHHDELSHKLREANLGVRELDNGFEFEFPGDPSTFETMSEWIPNEHACCPFFDIMVRWEREGGKIWLAFTGREGVKPFIRAEFSPWFRG